MTAAMIDEISKVRAAHRAADDSLFAQQNRVRVKEQQLAALRRQGDTFAEQAAVVERQLVALNAAVARERANLASLADRLGTLVGEFVLPQTPQQVSHRLRQPVPMGLMVL